MLHTTIESRTMSARNLHVFHTILSSLYICEYVHLPFVGITGQKGMNKKKAWIAKRINNTFRFDAIVFRCLNSELP